MKQCNMSRARENFPVLGSEDLHPTPSAGRKTAKLRGYGVSFHSPALRKCQTSRSSRGRSKEASLSEIVLLDTNGEEQAVGIGKIVSKRSDSRNSPILEGGMDDDELLVRIPNAEKEMKELEDSAFQAYSLDKHVTESARAHSPTEKVAKWLEESEQSALSELTYIHSPDHNEDASRYGQHEEQFAKDHLQWLATSLTATNETAVTKFDHQDSKLLAEGPPIDSFSRKATVRNDVKQDSEFYLAKVLVRYAKIMMCLSIIFIGLCMHHIPMSWNNFEPPPT